MAAALGGSGQQERGRWRARGQLSSPSTAQPLVAAELGGSSSVEAGEGRRGGKWGPGKKDTPEGRS